MRHAGILLVCALAAGCSQTTASNGGGAQTVRTAAAPQPATAATPASRQARCEQAIKKQQNAAVAGGLLSMAGGLGGFAGRGGAIVGQAASIGGSLVQSQAENSARDAVERECMP